MREIVLTVRAISAIALCVLPVFSTIQGIMPLSSTLAQSDNVVVGTVAASVEDVSNGSVELVVRRSLLGSMKAGSTVHAT